ncbi:MAG TPA: hypothetical protein VEP30_03655 [Chthoniobacterales bacterium]|nr:hypothetical protein [Chthoniobacterales bacterium]
MSLIPSESYSFPDHFTTTVIPSRRPKKEEPEAAPVEMRRKRPSIVALPNPKPQPAPATSPENSEAVRSKPTVPVPNPALRRANAPPPRIPETPVRKIPLLASLKPKLRWNMRAPAMDPAPVAKNDGEQIPPPPAAPVRNIIQMKPVPPLARPPRVMPPPERPVPQNPAPPPPPKPIAVAKTTRPAQAPVGETPRPVAVPNPQADFFEMFAQGGETALSKRRRKAKMRRFIACESVALAVLLPLAILGLARHPDNVALVWIMNILTIASAVAAALIPILFFAITPTLPEIER